MQRIEPLSSGASGGHLGGSVRIGSYPMKPPLAGAKVTLLCDGDRVCGVTTTNAGGDFRFRSLPAGAVAIRVDGRGYYPLLERGFIVKEGSLRRYQPLYLERCPKSDCDPKHAAAKPAVICL